MISLLSSFFKHEKIKPLGWLGIALGFAGIYLVISGRAGGFALSRQTWKGDLLLFAAVFLWAHYSVSARPLLKIYSPLKFTAVTMGLGSLMFFPFSVAPCGRSLMPPFPCAPGFAWLFPGCSPCPWPWCCGSFQCARWATARPPFIPTCSRSWPSSLPICSWATRSPRCCCLERRSCFLAFILRAAGGKSLSDAAADGARQ